MSAAWIEAAIQSAAPKIKTVITDTRKKGDGFLAAFDEVCKILEEDKLATRQVLANMSVLVHSSNRFTSGLDVSNVHDLLDNIVATGWAPAKVGPCVGFEPLNDADIEFNENLVTAADGYLGRVQREKIELLSISSSHTVALLRCIEDGAKHGDPGSQHPLCTNGCLSKELIYSKCPSIQAPLEKGMEWLKIRSDVSLALPELADFLSEAANSGQNVSQEHTKSQVLLQIHQKGHQNLRLLGDYKWDLVTKTIEANCISLKGEVAAMTQFVAKYSGGEKPKYLHELDEYAKSLPGRKDVNPAVMAKLGQLALTQAPEYVVSIVMALISSPNEWSNKGCSTLLGASEIAALGDTKKNDALEAAKLIRRVQAWSETAGMPASLSTKLVGELRVRLVYLVHGKTIKKKKQFKTRDQVLEQFCHDVLQAQPQIAQHCKPLTTPKDHLAAETSSVPSKSAAASSVMVTSSSGNVDIASVQGSGYTVGKHVCHMKNTSDKYLLKEFLDDGLVALDDGKAGGVIRKVKLAELLDEWKLTTVTQALSVQSVGQWSHNIIKYGQSFQEYIKSVARIGMVEAFDTTAAGVNLEIALKPSRSVKALQEYKARELEIVLFSPVLGTAKELKDISFPKAAVFGISCASQYMVYATYKLDEAMQKNEADGTIMTDEKKSFIHPFWLLQEVPAGANMEMSWKAVEVRVGSATPITVNVPMMVNTKVIKKGGELMIMEGAYKSKSAPGQKRPLDDAPAAAKASAPEPKAAAKASAPEQKKRR